MKIIKDILRGVAIGVANIIPGVSGGTMMVSMGIYEDVIHAVTGVFSHFKDSVRLLFPYLLGMLAGIGGLSFVIGYCFDEFPIQTAMLFIGLIFGGLPLLLPKVKGKRISVGEALLFAAFFALIIWMQFWNPGTDRTLTIEPMLFPILFIVGTIAAATMVIPGVSGSMMLMSLGYYTPIIDQIRIFIVTLFQLDFASMWGAFLILFPFGLGVLAGILLISKLVEYLMKMHERKTYFAILGLVASSPIAVLSGMNLQNITVFTVLAGLLLFIVGFVSANLLGK